MNSNTNTAKLVITYLDYLEKVFVMLIAYLDLQVAGLDAFCPCVNGPEIVETCIGLVLC